MRSPVAVLVGLFTAWGTIPLVVRAADLPAPTVVVGRVWLGALGLGLVEVVRRNDPGPRPFRHRPLRCLGVGALLALHWTALFAAYKRAPAGTVILVTYLAPVGVALLAPRMLGERTDRRVTGALAVAVAGAAVIAAPSVGTPSAPGVALALVAAVTFALLVVLSKPLAAVYGGRRAALVQLTAAGLCLVPVAATTSWAVSVPDWGWLVLLGLGHTAGGVTVYLWALSRLPAATTGTLGYLEPVMVVVWAWVVLGEVPTWATLAGGAMIVVAGALVARATAPKRIDEDVVIGVPG